jgi:hypothetical protein
VRVNRGDQKWREAVEAMRARRIRTPGKDIDLLYDELLEAALDVLYPPEPINLFKDEPEEPGATSPR